MLDQVCCILADGPAADLIRLDFKLRKSIFEKDFELLLHSPDGIPFGCAVYVCPIFLIKDVMGLLSGLSNSVLAYGPQKSLPLAIAAGASDYLRDGWDIEEFYFRCKQFLGKKSRELSWGLVFANGYLSKINEFCLELSPSEHRFFQILVENAGKILPHNALLKAIGMHNEHSRILSIYSSKIRRAIAAYSAVSANDVLFAVYGKGYYLQA